MSRELITIGGDDTAYAAMQFRARAASPIRVVHVPKTIDNDLDLPAYADTFRISDSAPSRC
jgi:6-phosphofructokinase 1